MISDKILLAGASANIYKEVMAEDKYADKAVSAGALKQIALQVGTNMQADQLGWNINVDPTKDGSFAKSLTSTFYNGLENKTVIGALNKAGDEIAANTARFEDVSSLLHNRFKTELLQLLMKQFLIQPKYILLPALTKLSKLL